MLPSRCLVVKPRNFSQRPHRLSSGRRPAYRAQRHGIEEGAVASVSRHDVAEGHAIFSTAQADGLAPAIIDNAIGLWRARCSCYEKGQREARSKISRSHATPIFFTPAMTAYLIFDASYCRAFQPRQANSGHRDKAPTTHLSRVRWAA